MTAADHRSLTGARRSTQTRQRLTEAAILVIARRGIIPSLIEDVARAAGVSRGTFYNHFPAIPDLLAAADRALADEVMRLIVARITPLADPAEASAVALRLFLMAARDYPLVARFSAEVGLAKPQPLDIVQDLGTELMAHGVRTGQFVEMPIDLTVGMISATVALSLQHQVEGRAFEISMTVAAILRLLGVAPGLAEALAQRPLEPLAVPAGSLIARSHEVFCTQAPPGAPAAGANA